MQMEAEVGVMQPQAEAGGGKEATSPRTSHRNLLCSHLCF